MHAPLPRISATKYVLSEIHEASTAWSYYRRQGYTIFLYRTRYQKLLHYMSSYVLPAVNSFRTPGSYICIIEIYLSTKVNSINTSSKIEYYFIVLPKG